MTSLDQLVSDSVGLIHVEIDVDRRSVEPIDRLSRDLDDACTAAVTSHQIAALLEAEGLNDRIAQEQYERSSVFALASDLYERVPMREPDAASANGSVEPLPGERSTATLVMRGPIYLVPVVFFVAVGQFLSSDRSLWIGLLALFLAWAWNQGLGSLVYQFLGRGDLPSAFVLSRVSLIAGTILVTALVMMVVPNGLTDPSGGLFAAGQTAYLIAAATLLTFGWDKVLVAVLLPGLLLVTLSLVVPAIPDWFVLSVTLGTLAMVVGATLWKTRGTERARIPALSRSDGKIAGLQALLGAVWATLIGLAGISILGSSNVVTTVSIAAIPMVVTMGVAEWQLLRFRRKVRSLLLTTQDPRVFGERARWAFASSAAVFLLTLVLSTAAVGIGVLAAGVMTMPGLVLAIGFIGLGAAFFAGLTLVSLGNFVDPLSASVVGVFFVASLLAGTSYQVLGSAGIYASGCCGLSLLLVVAVFMVIPQVAAHR